MKGWRFAILSLTLTLTLALARAAPIESAASDKYSNIRTIGIISAIGDYFTIAKADIISSRDIVLPINMWKLDNVATDEISAQLAGRFTIKPVPYSRADFSKQENGWWTNSDKEIHRTISEFSNTNEIDAYLVVLKNSGSTIYANPPRFFHRGVGVLMFNPQIGGTDNVEFANFKIALIDAKTNHTIAEDAARIPAIGLTAITSPHFPIDDTLLPDKTGHFTEEQMDEFQADIKKLVRLGLRQTLKEMSLSRASPR